MYEYHDRLFFPFWCLFSPVLMSHVFACIISFCNPIRIYRAIIGSINISKHSRLTLLVLSEMIVTKGRNSEKEKEMSDYFVQWFFRLSATCPIFLPRLLICSTAIDLRNTSGPKLVSERCDASPFKFVKNA